MPRRDNEGGESQGHLASRARTCAFEREKKLKRQNRNLMSQDRMRTRVDCFSLWMIFDRLLFVCAVSCIHTSDFFSNHSRIWLLGFVFVGGTVEQYLLFQNYCTSLDLCGKFDFGGLFSG